MDLLAIPSRGNRKKLRRANFISKLSHEFSTLITDESFHDLVKQTEDLKRILEYMWCPTRPLENVGQYAIAKHASIHYILSTHALLPSSECFTLKPSDKRVYFRCRELPSEENSDPWFVVDALSWLDYPVELTLQCDSFLFNSEDIQRIMHLPMEWIGALPRQEDTRCITKFISRFAELFAEKTGLTAEAEDPLDRYARKCGQRVFMDIIRYASTGALPVKPPRKVRQTENLEERSVNTADGTIELESYPPLDWTDQLSRTKVKIYDMPQCGKTRRTYMPSRRKVKNPCYIQEHTSLVAVNEANIMREVAQTLTALESDKHKYDNKVDRYSKSHSLRRAVLISHAGNPVSLRSLDLSCSRSNENQILDRTAVTYTGQRIFRIYFTHRIQCPGLRDRPEKPRHISIIDQLEKEKKQFDAIVENLPHRLHDIAKLRAISSRNTDAQPPKKYLADWIIDPTDKVDQKQAALLWNPNRRIYVENEVREQHRSPKYIRALDETRLVMESSRSKYDAFNTSYGLDPQKRFSRISVTSRRRSQMPTKLSLARWSVAKSAAGPLHAGQCESNILDDMHANNANSGVKLPPIATGHRGFPERKPGNVSYSLSKLVMENEDSATVWRIFHEFPARYRLRIFQ
ncbi:hypothetical protein CLF_101272 [Clonorchis sinensis]|uniref:Uncharacterized protein n=1 Tax=Clonorchis sinensis TaxID=79923 RepID=G7Y5E0_CLOSI|nr:hypothetical protein CLF_101272 [Clonorchis sinensis]